MSDNCWLMKAEPDSRMEKGKDVKFGVDDFEKVGVTPWDGVRSHEAKKIMKERMAIGDRVLFYHSNTKLPGVAAFAKVDSASYPDPSAFDASHPYHDPKSKEDSPTWYLVDVRFVERIPHFVSLKLLQTLGAMDEVPEALNSYLTADHLAAIKGMALLNRGRLSVQPVSAEAYAAIELLGRNGGFDDIVPAKKARAPKAKTASGTGKKRKAASPDEGDEEEEDQAPAPKKGKGRARKAKAESEADDSSAEEAPPRRTTARTRK